MQIGPHCLVPSLTQTHSCLQAVNWIKRREGKQLEGKMKSFSDSDALKQLELAIQYGLPFLFENIDEYIDPVVDPVLERTVTEKVSFAGVILCILKSIMPERVWYISGTMLIDDPTPARALGIERYHCWSQQGICSAWSLTAASFAPDW